MLNYTIGAVKKKSTAKKKTTAKKTTAKKVTAKAPAKKAKREWFPSTPSWLKDYKVTATCSDAGSKWKTTGSSNAAGILALCRASAKNLKTTAAALSKYGVTRGKLSRKK
jgi:hypothetical protein